MGPLAERDHDRSPLEMRFEAAFRQDSNKTSTTTLPDNEDDEDRGKSCLSVRFLECPQYRETISREDLSQKEKDDTWYSTEEYVYIKTVNSVTVRMMSSDRSLDPEIYCARGLVRSMNTSGF